MLSFYPARRYIAKGCLENFKMICGVDCWLRPFLGRWLPTMALNFDFAHWGGLCNSTANVLPSSMGIQKAIGTAQVVSAQTDEPKQSRRGRGANDPSGPRLNSSRLLWVTCGWPKFLPN